MGKPERRGPFLHAHGLSGGFRPQAVVDGEDGELQIGLFAVRPAFGEAHQRRRIGSTGNREGHMALAVEG
jgi:hypothetical protein